jgi:hypothetical protein
MKNGDKPITPLLDLNKDKSGLWGLTKREYFAGLAMQGMLSNPNTGTIEDGKRIVNFIHVSESSLLFADELLKQLEDESK